MFETYLREDVLRSKDNYERWKEAYNFYLGLDKSSQALLTYYRREAEVAYEVWQFKVRNFNKKFKLNPIEEQ